MPSMGKAVRLPHLVLHTGNYFHVHPCLKTARNMQSAREAGRVRGGAEAPGVCVSQQPSYPGTSSKPPSVPLLEPKVLMVTSAVCEQDPSSQ